MRFEDLAIGTKVYWLSAVMVRSGVVIAFHPGRRPSIVVNAGDHFRLIEQLDELHPTEQAVWMARAFECQRQAAELLGEANQAFKSAGWPALFGVVFEQTPHQVDVTEVVAAAEVSEAPNPKPECVAVEAEPEPRFRNKRSFGSYPARTD